jgi:hypothetical protein
MWAALCLFSETLPIFRRNKLSHELLKILSNVCAVSNLKLDSTCSSKDLKATNST